MIVMHRENVLRQAQDERNERRNSRSQDDREIPAPLAPVGGEGLGVRGRLR